MTMTQHTPYNELMHTWTATGETFDSFDILVAKNEGYLLAKAEDAALLAVAENVLTYLGAHEAELEAAIKQAKEGAA